MATEEVLNAIPHRPPFLFIDEVVESNEESLTAKRFIPESEAFFQGHYPGNPIMPGVLLSEAVFQAGAIFASRLLADTIAESPELVPVVTKIMDARFKSIVRPGDTLFIAASFKNKMGNFLFMDGGIKNQDDKRVMTISFCVALAKPA